MQGGGGCRSALQVGQRHGQPRAARPWGLLGRRQAPSAAACSCHKRPHLQHRRITCICSRVCQQLPLLGLAKQLLVLCLVVAAANALKGRGPGQRAAASLLLVVLFTHAHAPPPSCRLVVLQGHKGMAGQGRAGRVSRRRRNGQQHVALAGAACMHCSPCMLRVASPCTVCPSVLCHASTALPLFQPTSSSKKPAPRRRRNPFLRPTISCCRSLSSCRRCWWGWEVAATAREVSAPPSCEYLTTATPTCEVGRIWAGSRGGGGVPELCSATHQAGQAQTRV